ncbi:MAG: TAXI family TRAP transporter solute-binding subunit [Blautia sp.]
MDVFVFHPPSAHGLQWRSKKAAFRNGWHWGCVSCFADTFANILNTETDDFQTEVKTTAGSAANLRLLSEGYIQLAVVQADLLQDAWNGEGSFAGRKDLPGLWRSGSSLHRGLSDHSER